MNCHEEAPEGISPKYRMKLGPGRDFMLMKVRIGSILIINYLLLYAELLLIRRLLGLPEVYFLNSFISR